MYFYNIDLSELPWIMWILFIYRLKISNISKMYVMIEKSINYQMLPNSLFKSQTARNDFVIPSPWIIWESKVCTAKIQNFWDPEKLFGHSKAFVIMFEGEKFLCVRVSLWILERSFLTWQNTSPGSYKIALGFAQLVIALAFLASQIHDVMCYGSIYSLAQ